MPAYLTPLDWKFYGGTEINGEHVEAYFLSSHAVRFPNSNVTVWSKYLKSKNVHDAFDAQEVIDKTVFKQKSGYLPPMSTLHKFSQQQLFEIAASEQIADLEPISPVYQVLWELNCAESKYRQLSHIFGGKSQAAPDDKPTEWASILKDSSVETLRAFLCKTN